MIRTLLRITTELSITIHEIGKRVKGQKKITELHVICLAGQNNYLYIKKKLSAAN